MDFCIIYSELLRMTSRRRLNYDTPDKPHIVQQQESTTPVRPPLPSDVTYISPLMQQHQQDSTSTCSSNSSSSSSPTLKARDSDESGFSSIGSFQEVWTKIFHFFLALVEICFCCPGRTSLAE